jgi:hypothetical protein
MSSESKRPLRSLVEKWLGPNSGQRNRIINFTRTRVLKGRYVQGEVANGSQLCTLFFFRHGDGCWYVFPPSEERPKMVPERLAA